MRTKEIICADNGDILACFGEVRRVDGVNLCAAHAQEYKELKAEYNELYDDEEGGIINGQVNPTPVDYYYC